MRHLNARGLTLVEVMVGLAIAAFLALSAGPFFGDYVTNSRLRAAGDLLYVETLAAQSEAVKRNNIVRLSTSNNRLQVIDLSNPNGPVVLRERFAAEEISYGTVTLDFEGQGRPRNFPSTGSVDVSSSAVTCSADYRCPGVRVDAGGGVRMCSNRLSSCT